MSSERGAPGDAQVVREVGLCARCVHGRQQANARGSVFWRCGRSESDPRFARYPPLPVLSCEGFGPADERC